MTLRQVKNCYLQHMILAAPVNEIKYKIRPKLAEYRILMAMKIRRISKVPTTLPSHVVYHIKCPGCIFSCVGLATRHLATQLQEHSRASSHVDTYLLKSGQTMENASVPWKMEVLDRSYLQSKLLTLEALQYLDDNRALIRRSTAHGPHLKDVKIFFVLLA